MLIPKLKNTISNASLGVLVLVWVGQGGRNASVMHGVSLSFFALWLILLMRGELARPARHLLLPSVAGLLVCSGLSAIGTPCFFNTAQSLTKLWVVIAFGVIAVSCWEANHRKAFRLMMIGGSFFQSFLIIVSHWRHRPAPLFLPGNPQYVSLWLCVAALVAAGSALDRLEGKRNALFGFVSVSIASAVFLLPTRSAVVALLVGIGLITARRWGRKGFLSFCAALLMILAALPQAAWTSFLKTEDPLAWKRIDIWETAVRGLAEKSIFGWGPGQFETLYREHAVAQGDSWAHYEMTTSFAHNEYLQVAAEHGVLALVFLLWGLALYFIKHRPRTGSSLGQQAAVLSAAIFSFFNFPFTLPACGFLAAGLLSAPELLMEENDRRREGGGMALRAGRVVLMAALLALIAWNGLSVWGGKMWNPSTLIKEADGMLHAKGNGPSPSDAEDAEEKLQTAIHCCGSDPEAWHALAHLNLDHKSPPDLAAAKMAIRQALRWHPTHAPWLLEWSRLLEREGNLEGAFRAAQQAARLEPNFSGAALQVGRLLRRRGDARKAEAWLGHLLRKSLKRLRAGEGLSPYAATLLRSDPDDIRREISIAQMDQARYGDALETLAEIRKRADPDDLVLEAKAHYLLGHMQESRNRLGKALLADPGNDRLRRQYESLFKKP